MCEEILFCRDPANKKQRKSKTRPLDTIFYYLGSLMKQTWNRTGFKDAKM